MNLAQTLLIGLILLTTWGAIAESSTHVAHRFTIECIVLAVIIPLAWIAVIIYLPNILW